MACFVAGYSFFDSGDIARLGREQARAASISHLVGEYLQITLGLKAESDKCL